MEKIIHQIWVGEYEMPNKEKYFLERCKKINPDFIHILWTNENLPILPEKVQAHCDYFTAKKDYAFVADVLRVYLIHLLLQLQVVEDQYLHHQHHQHQQF